MPENLPNQHTAGAKKSWKELDFTEQRVYIRQAEYLVEKGYVKGDPFEIAKSLYYKRSK